MIDTYFNTKRKYYVRYYDPELVALVGPKVGADEDVAYDTFDTFLLGGAAKVAARAKKDGCTEIKVWYKDPGPHAPCRLIFTSSEGFVLSRNDTKYEEARQYFVREGLIEEHEA